MELKFEPFYQEYLDTMAAYDLAMQTIYTDQSTIAPRKGAPYANECMAILSQKAFEHENNPQTAERILDYASRVDPLSLEGKELALRKEMIEDNRSIPSEVVAAYTKTRADSETAWHVAKPANDYPSFKDHMKNTMEGALNLMKYSPRFTGENGYDLMLDSYEKGMDEKSYDEFFQVIKEELLPLIEKVKAARQIDDSRLKENFDIKAQEELAEDLLDLLEADRDLVYLGTTEHPFTCFYGPQDARITTHYYPDALVSAILSTVHEYGHALFWLQMDPGLSKTLLVNGTGSAAHESQSRFLENHIGRSLPFWKALYPKLVEHFPQLSDLSAEEIWKMVNVSRPSLVRTEADELTYPLHILIRYEIEKMMAEGTLDYDKLPEIWNDLYEKYLGVRPDTDTEGVLQDMHWSAGNFGYFPTYALGTAYAAQLAEAMEKELDLEEIFEKGEFHKVVDWLRENVHHYGNTKSMKEIVEIVSKKPFDPHIYTNYLKKKYSELYHLDPDE